MQPGLTTTCDKLRRLLAAVLLTTLFTPTMGQQVVPGASVLDAEEEEEVRRYAVEIIIFEYTDRASAGTEIFDPEELPVLAEEDFIFGDSRPDAVFGSDDIDRTPLEPVFTDAPLLDSPAHAQSTLDGEILVDDTDVLLPPVAEVELVEIPTHEQAGLKILTPEEYVLDNAYERLQTLDAYRPIMRAGWSQPTLEKDVTVPITLRRLGNPPLRLDGTMTLYLSRFLHLVVDLELEETAPQRTVLTDNRARRYGDERSRFGFNSSFESPSTYYRINEDRIVRNDELRYFDHPRFGVLAKIWRIEEEDPADEEIGLFGAPRPVSSQN